MVFETATRSLAGERSVVSSAALLSFPDSVVVLDITTGEVLAMVNQPAYNPNDRDHLTPAMYRNRAATDMFEPGSSIKPFFVAAGIASGKYDERSIIDTSPGFIKVGVKTFEDEHDLGAVNIATILAKSSNVGMAHIAHHTDLVKLDLWGALITADGVAHLKGLRKLEWLRLRNVPIGDAGIAHLHGCTALKYLGVQEATQVTAAGVAAFHAAVPRCQIEHNGPTINPAP